MAVGISKLIGSINFGVSMDTRKLRKDTTKARGILNKFVGTVGGAGKAGLVGAAAAGTAAIVKMSQSYEQLNRSMNRSLSIMGNVSDTMRTKMTQAAIDVSAVTNASASEAAQGYFFLASAGLDAAQSLEALPKVANFAQAGNFELSLATDLLTDAQSALGLSVKDNIQNMRNMDRVSDVLVKANTLANASVQQFSEALTNKAGAALRLVNKDIEEGVALLAVYADQGIKGAEAGTGMGIVMRDLQTKALKFSTEFKAANVAVFDVSGNMRNMADIVSDLERRLLGLSDAQKKATLLDLGFSDKSVAFVQALLGTSEKIREYESNLRSAAGTTAEVAGKMLTPMEKATNKLGAAFEKLSQSMRPMVDLLATTVDEAARFIESLQGVGRYSRFANGVDVGAERRRLIQVGRQRIDRNPAYKGDYNAKNNAGVALVNRVNSMSDLQLIRSAEQHETVRSNTAAFLSGVKGLPDGLRRFASSAKESFAQKNKYFADVVKPIADSVGDAVSRVFSSSKAKTLAGIGTAFVAARFAQAGKANLDNQNAAASRAAMFANLQARGQGRSRTPLTFSDAGSAEGFSQRARIKSNNQQEKLDRKRNNYLAEIVDKIGKVTTTQTANLGG